MLEIDEFALLRGHRYATVLIDAEIGKRVEVLPDRKMQTVTAWLREHSGVEIVCRDGAGGFSQAVTGADPAIVQVMDRWHLWHGLGEAALKEVAAHSTCWTKAGPPVTEGRRAANTRERWHQVHQLLDAGVGLLDCAPAEPSPEHRKTLCPPSRTRAAGPGPGLPAHPGGPLPRPPAPAPGGEPGRPCHPPPARDP
ncbi:ISL3 family transposase [Streptomyces sp. XH2]|uniref:ISL3 family transposase n=1 Tax=Streptomyces sp. XH2 TaxID=3412483 RepID=UPI003C7C086B